MLELFHQREKVGGHHSLPRKPLHVVLACRNGALLGPLSLVREHMSLEILKGLATVRVRAALLFPGLIAAVWLLARVVGLEGHKTAPSLGVDRRLKGRVWLVITIMHEGGGAAGPELR